MERMVREEHPRFMTGFREKLRTPKVSFRSVFHQGDGSRLAIGMFNRPLVDEECRTLKDAWTGSLLPELEDFEVSTKQVSFLAKSYRVDQAWRSIDAVLARGAGANVSERKAS
jgi:hypothetical protein